MPKSEDNQKARERECYREGREDPTYLAKRRAQGREAQAWFKINHPDRVQRNNLNQRERTARGCARRHEGRRKELENYGTEITRIGM
ncbi:hypothetical protein GYMLUDRAFT_550462 [Collybiopsis luxurians FD-317 M1]|nr:hypothetical protein GYMLUDRAFT_550462 [Collybiopsis luxurians FD-317 M1]